MVPVPEGETVVVPVGVVVPAPAPVFPDVVVVVDVVELVVVVGVVGVVTVVVVVGAAVATVLVEALLELLPPPITPNFHSKPRVSKAAANSPSTAHNHIGHLLAGCLGVVGAT